MGLEFILPVLTPVFTAMIGFVVTLTYARLGKMEDRLTTVDNRLTAIEAVERYKKEIHNVAA